MFPKCPAVRVQKNAWSVISEREVDVDPERFASLMGNNEGGMRLGQEVTESEFQLSFISRIYLVNLFISAGPFCTMQESRPSTPAAPPQDLWSSILDSISSTRSIPSKQVLLLGHPSSGKSVLASALLQKPVPADDSNDASRTDFALGYDWADIRDDGDEGESLLQ